MNSIRAAPEGSAMQRYYQASIRDNPDIFVKDTIDGFDKIAQDEERKSLFFTGELAALINRDIVALDLTDDIPSFLCWAFKEDSEFIKLFNYHILHDISTGLWAKTFRVRNINSSKTVVFLPSTKGVGLRRRASVFWLFGILIYKGFARSYYRPSCMAEQTINGNQLNNESIVTRFVTMSF